MTLRGPLRPGLALVAAPIALAACDLLITEPAPAPSEITVSFQVQGTPLGGSATAFSRVRRVGLRFVRPDSTTRDTVVAALPVGGVIRTGIVVPATERVSALGVQARLGYDTLDLFRGGTVVAVAAGSPTTAEVTLLPVPAHVVANRASVSLVGLGATDQLSSAVLFASGDTIDGLSGIWSSADPTVAAVGPNGTVLAQGLGQTTLEVRFDTLSDTVSVDVLPPVPTTGGPNRWIEGLGGVWSDPVNWSLGRIPIAGDSVEITLDGTYSVDIDIDPPVLSSLRIGASVGAQSVTASGRAVTVAGDATVEGTGSATMDGTTLAAAAVSVAAGTSLTLTGGAVVSAPLANAGEVRADNAGAFLNGAVTNSATAAIRVGGGTFVSSLTIQSGFTNFGLIELAGGARLTVAGTLVNESGASISVVSGPIAGGRFLTAELDNRGTLSIAAALELDAPGATHSNSGGILSTGGALVRVTGADAFDNTGTLDAGTSSVDVTLTGTGAGFTTSGSVVVGGGQLSIYNGPFVQTAGAITGGGVLRLFDMTAAIPATVTLGTTVPVFFQLYNVTLTTPGVEVVPSTGFILSGSTLDGALTNRGSFSAIGPAVSTVTGATGSASGASLTVESGPGGDTELVLAGGLANAGFAILTNSSGATGALLTVSGGPLVNTATGTITAAPGPGGARRITAALDNRGFVSNDHPLTIDATGTTLSNSGTLGTNSTSPLTVVGADAVVNTGVMDATAGPVVIGLSGPGATFTNSASLIAGPGSTFTISNGALTVDATGGLGGAGLFELIGVAVTLSSPIPWTLGTGGPAAVRLESSSLAATGVVVDTTATLTLRGSTIDAPLTVVGTVDVEEGASDLTGSLTTDAIGTLRVTGGATAAAVLSVPGAFTNLGLIELTSTGSGDATVAIGNGTLTNGSGGVVSSSLRGGGVGTRTIGAALTQLGTVSLQAPLTVTGELSDPPGIPSTYAGNGNALTVAGVNVSGAVFDDMPLVTLGGSLTAFSNNTFQNMDPAATQLTIEHPGTLSGLLSFTSVTFSTTPTTGLYMSVADTDPLSLPLVIEMLLASPLTGLSLSQVLNGATLIW